MYIECGLRTPHTHTHHAGVAIGRMCLSVAFLGSRRRRRRRNSVYIRRGLEDFGSNHLAPGLVGQVVRSVSERSLSDACDGQDVHATET